MHTNYRRKNKFRAKHHRYTGNGWGCLYAPSLRWWKVTRSRKRRARERHLMAHERYDDMLQHYPRDILWDYW